MRNRPGAIVRFNDEDLGTLEIARLRKRVDAIACDVLGHLMSRNEYERDGGVYHWAYCLRCGGVHEGEPPPITNMFQSMGRLWLRFHELSDNAVITGITDPGPL